MLKMREEVNKGANQNSTLEIQEDVILKFKKEIFK
ncbi:MAG: Unknown protein [uncultured Sulfurovum sp.]|uniref:Uncharacterized protein n=1 Tax=uncultured Sulfurovum sp. TaxID=269237 RepID=A0A6S6U116_9BACT|nr:MAG: Unknown protein [uncultured Sulfurovum sp.]